MCLILKMSRVNYKKFQWIEKKCIILLPEILLLIIDSCLDNITCCNFLRTCKFFYNHKCNPYYLYIMYDETIEEYSYVCEQDIKPEYKQERKIVKLFDYYSCRLYLNFYYKYDWIHDVTFFGFITNAPLDLFHITEKKYNKTLINGLNCEFLSGTYLSGTIAIYDSCKKIYFKNPFMTRCLYLYLKENSQEIHLSVLPARESEYLHGRRLEFKQNGIDVIHTTNNNFSIGNNIYFISCITSVPILK